MFGRGALKAIRCDGFFVLKRKEKIQGGCMQDKTEISFCLLVSYYGDSRVGL